MKTKYYLIYFEPAAKDGGYRNVHQALSFSGCSTDMAELKFVIFLRVGAPLSVFF